MNKHIREKIAIFFAKFLLRKERGETLVSFFTSIARDFVMVGLAMDLIYRYLHWKVPYWLVIIMVLSYPFAMVLIGFIDQKVGFWKVQNNYQYTKLNPHFEEMGKRLERIENEINKKLK